MARVLAPVFPSLQLLLAIPEHQTPLPGGRQGTQTDLLVLAKNDKELVVIAVEGKVNEPFGPTVAEWLQKDSPGKRRRLSFLCDLLQVEQAAVQAIRYQLLHRTAAAVLEARRLTAATAVMLVHSFSQDHQWFADFAAFAALFGAEARPDMTMAAGSMAGTSLYLSWVCGEAVYLTR